jgi:hypothetical protein
MQATRSPSPRLLGATLSALVLVACASVVTTPPKVQGVADGTDASLDADADPFDAATEADVPFDAADGDSGEDASTGTEVAGPCPTDMALVSGAPHGPVCIDRYEASVVEVQDDGTERPHAHYEPVDGKHVRAVSVPGVFPQGFISEVQAEAACEASHKRLCAEDEWVTACEGAAHQLYPYGNTRTPGACHDQGKSAVGAVFGAAALAQAPAAPGRTPTGARGPATPPAPSHAGTAHAGAAHGPRPQDAGAGGRKKPKNPRKTPTPTSRAGKPPRPGPAHAASKRPKRPAPASARPASVTPSVWTQLNDPRLGQVPGALSHTGEHAQCKNDAGVYDLMGNLHEWVRPKDPAHGTFRGGYYLDTSQNGEGCRYKTQAHAHDYHDYSTGFRCCMDIAAEEP